MLSRCVLLHPLRSSCRHTRDVSLSSQRPLRCASASSCGNRANFVSTTVLLSRTPTACSRSHAGVFAADWRACATAGASPSSRRSAAGLWRRQREPPARKKYEVLRLRKDGTISSETVDVASLLRGNAIHVRDLMQLAPDQMELQHAPPLLLPRGDNILVALGHIKAILRADSMVLFKPVNKHDEEWLRSLSEILLSSGASAKPSEVAAENRLRAQAFELAMLEEILHEVCATFEQRVQLFRPLVDAMLPGGMIAEEALQRIVILKDSLSNFELAVSDLTTLLNDLLGNNEDMVRIMLTEQRAARARGETGLDEEQHDVVELLLENYLRQLTSTLHDVVAMQRLVQSKQELAAISLDVYRNRMVRMNVHLGIGSVSLGVCTTVAGYLGMNLDIPAAFPSFWATVAGSTMVGAAVYLACVTYATGYSAEKRALRRVEEINALQSIFRDLRRMDYVLKSAMVEEELCEETFQQIFREASNGRPVSALETRMLFRLLDRSGDGVLQFAELQQASPTHKHC